MKRLLILLAFATLGSTAFSAARVVDISFDADGRFAHRATLAPKEMLEICGKLAKGNRLQWSYEASAPLPFNIHFHQGKEVVFPAKLERAERAQGVQVLDAEPAHCWMWTNKTAESVTVDVTLQQLR